MAVNILMEQCRPLVKPLQDFIHNVSHSLHLDIPFLLPELKLSNSGLSGRINDCKHKLATLKDASLSSAGVSESLDAASDFFTKVVVIYEAIELYNLTLKMSSSIENLANSPVKTSSDDLIGRFVSNYEQRISQKMLQVILDRASQNFALWVFPFASFYLNDTISNHGTNADNPDQFLTHIERLEENLIDYKTNLTSRIYVKEVPFSTGITGSRPFYTWDNQKYSETISNLLAGQRVTLFADVRNYGLDVMDAIKFKLVEVDLQLENVTNELTSEFDSVKESLGVQLTHCGLSSYRINGKYFEIHGHSQTLTYNYKRDHQGNRLGTNLVYEKFKSGEFMLSPYTQWNIQLKLTKGNNSNDNRSLTFENLARFAPYIQLNLVGHGLYVDPRELDTSGDKLMLENFYTEDTRPFLNLRF